MLSRARSLLADADRADVVPTGRKSGGIAGKYRSIFVSFARLPPRPLEQARPGGPVCHIRPAMAIVAEIAADGGRFRADHQRSGFNVSKLIGSVQLQRWLSSISDSIGVYSTMASELSGDGLRLRPQRCAAPEQLRKTRR